MRGEPGDAPRVGVGGIDALGQRTGQVEAQPRGRASHGEADPDPVHHGARVGVAVGRRRRHAHQGLGGFAVPGSALIPDQGDPGNPPRRQPHPCDRCVVGGGERPRRPVGDDDRRPRRVAALEECGQPGRLHARARRRKELGVVGPGHARQARQQTNASDNADDPDRDDRPARPRDALIRDCRPFRVGSCRENAMVTMSRRGATGTWHGRRQPPTIGAGGAMRYTLCGELCTKGGLACGLASVSCGSD
jgi:hypothetical protein